MKTNKKNIITLTLRKIAFASIFVFFLSSTSTALAIVQGDGKIIYGEGAVTTPRVTDFSTTFGAEGTGAAAAATIKHTNMKASPTRDEMIAGVQTSGGVLYVQRWDGTTWTNEWNVTVGDGSLARFDLSYERSSGDLIIVYSRNVGTTNEIGYRVWNGTSWTAETTYDAVRTTGVVQGIALVSRGSGSDHMAMAWGDASFVLSANYWDGSAWQSEPSAALATSLSKVGTATSLTNWSFDLEFESISGELLVVWGIDATVDPRFVTRGAGAAGAWSAIQTATALFEEPTDLDLSGDPGSDYIAYINSTDNGADSDAAMWTGSAWANASNFDVSNDTLTAGTSNNAIGWVTSGAQVRAVGTYDDANAAGIDWIVFDKNAGTWTVMADCTTACNSQPASGDDMLHRIRMNPFDGSKLLWIGVDINSDLYAKSLSFDGTNLTWSSTEPSNVTLEATVSSIAGIAADFAFHRLIPTPPTVTTQAASSVLGTSATLNGNITATGGASATVRGFAYSTSSTLATTIATTTNSGTFSTGAFTEAVSSLSCGTTYYFRPYATNTGGTGYGTTVSFTTPGCPPTVNNSAPSPLAQSTVTLNANIISTGGTDPTVRGFAYGRSSTLSSDVSTTTNNGTFSTGIFSESLGGLLCNSTYYYRAYATNSSGTGYASSIVAFTTNACSGVTASVSSSFPIETSTNANSASLSGSIGGGSVGVTGRGFVYGTDSTLSTGNSTTTEMGTNMTGSFSATATLNGVCGTTYYARAYAVNSAGISFGVIRSFVSCLPYVTVGGTSDVTKTTATIYGSISHTGGTNATVRGFAYGTDSSFSSPIATTTNNGSFAAGTFTEAISSLTCNTSYYYRPYATNPTGTAFGFSTSFSTAACPPTVVSIPASVITPNSAILKGDVTNSGGVSGTAQGFAWGTTASLSGGDTATTTRTTSVYVGRFSSRYIDWSTQPAWDVTSSGASQSRGALGDLDNDGDYDMLIGDFAGASYGYENTGSTTTPAWTAKATWNAPDVGDYSTPILADLDNDSDLDLLIGEINGISFGYENTGTVSSPIWVAKSTWNTPDVGSGAVPSVADLDNDGDKDLMIGENGGLVYGYENTGTVSSPTWAAKAAWDSPYVGNPTNPTMADLDGDGDYDLLVSNNFTNIYGYENSGTVSSPTWTTSSDFKISDVAITDPSPHLVDMDRDGDYDVMMGTNGNVVYGYSNTSQGLPALACNTTYYFRPYATNSGGTGYGAITSFTTSPCVPPTVTTQAASSVATTTATLNGNITVTGGASSTVRGFAYGTSATMATTIATTTNNGTFGTGAFTEAITSLTCNTTYYARPYATNVAGTGYGSILSFTTSACAPTVTTQAASSIASTTATLNGNITATGGASATVRGFAYGTSTTLATTIATTTNNGTFGIGAFTENIASLTCNTTYYFRPYATNTAGTSYGSITSFTTSACAPTVTTQAASSITQTTATLNGNITSTGGASVTTRGFAYGTDSGLSTVIATSTNAGPFGAGAFTEAISSLTCNTTYYFRPYATNPSGTSFGTIVSFTSSACLPTVTTQAASSITDTTATLNGNITVTGGASSTVRGFAYGTSATMATTIATTTNNGTFGAGAFTEAISSLTCNTTYYFRPYATNPGGVGYGTIESFITSACANEVVVSGVIYQSDTTTPLTGVGLTVRVAKNGTLSQSVVSTSGTGAFTLPGVTGAAAGDVFTIFVDSATASQQAAAVTHVVDASSPITVNLFAQHLIVRSESATVVTNTDLGLYDADNNANIFFTSNGTPKDLSITGSNKLLVWAGDTYTPGGAVTTPSSSLSSSVKGDLEIQTGATLAMGTSTLSLGGDLTNTGTFSYSSGQTTTLTATGVTTISGATSFNNFTSATPGQTIRFTAGQIFTINGAFNISGSSGRPVLLRSTSEPTQWTVNFQGTSSMSSVSVKDSACHASSLTINLSSSIDITNSGNNGSCWSFPYVHSGGGGSYGSVESFGSGTLRSGGIQDGGVGDPPIEGSGTGAPAGGGGSGGGGTGDLGYFKKWNFSSFSKFIKNNSLLSAVLFFR